MSASFFPGGEDMIWWGGGGNEVARSMLAAMLMIAGEVRLTMILTKETTAETRELLLGLGGKIRFMLLPPS
jgi:hypothetical protein